MPNCANCGLSLSEIKNRVLLQSKVADIEQWAEHIYSWVLECERQIGTFNGLRKVVNYKIENDTPTTKTPLPDDIYQLEDVQFCGRASYYTGSSSHFATSCNCGCGADCTCVKWFVNGCYIQSSSKVSDVIISYLAMPIDEEGFPYVRESHISAIISFIKYMMLQSRFDEGKVPMGVYNTRYREWIMRRNEAIAYDNNPVTEEEMARLANIYNEKLPVHYRRNLGNQRDFVVIPL